MIGNASATAISILLLLLAFAGGGLAAEGASASTSMDICGATIKEGQDRLDALAKRVEALKLQLEKSPSAPAPQGQPGIQARTPESGLIASAETDVGLSGSYIGQAQKAFADARKAVAQGDEHAAGEALEEALRNIGAADHVTASAQSAVEIVSQHIRAKRLDTEGLLAELKHAADTSSQAAYVYAGPEGGAVLARSWALDAFGGARPPGQAASPVQAEQATNFFHARNAAVPVGGIKLTMSELNLASIDPVKKSLLLVGHKGAGARGDIDGDLFWTALRLAGQSDGFEPDFSIDPVDNAGWEREWQHLGDYFNRTFLFDQSFFATASTHKGWDGLDYQINVLDRIDPKLTARLHREFKIQELLRFEPGWLRSTRLGEVLYRADLAIKELSLPVAVTGEPTSRAESVPAAMHFSFDSGESKIEAFRFWFVPGTQIASGPAMLDLSQVKPVLKVVRRSGGKDLDAALPPWVAAMRDDVNNRFDLYARVIPEWAQLAQVFRAYAFGVWLRRTERPSFEALMSRAPEPEPPSEPLPQILNPYVVVIFRAEENHDGNRVNRTAVAWGGIAFTPERPLSPTKIDDSVTGQVRRQFDLANRDTVAAKPSESVAVELALTSPAPDGAAIPFAAPLRNPAVLEATLAERYGRYRDALRPRGAAVAEDKTVSPVQLGILLGAGVVLAGALGLRQRRRDNDAAACRCAYCSRASDGVSATGHPCCARCGKVHRTIDYGAVLVGGGIVALAVLDIDFATLPLFATVTGVILLVVVAARSLRRPNQLHPWIAGIDWPKGRLLRRGVSYYREARRGLPLAPLALVDLFGLAALVIVAFNAASLAHRLIAAWSGPRLLLADTVDDQVLFQLMAAVQGLAPLPGANLLGDSAGIALVAGAMWLAYKLAAAALVLILGLRPESWPRLASAASRSS